MTTRRDLLAWGAIVLLGGVCSALGWWLGHRVLFPEQPVPPGLVVYRTGDTVPPTLSVPALSGGRPVVLGGPGPVRVVNFWASWCGPCREEMPVLDAFAREQVPGEVQVIGVALDTRAEAEAFLAQVPVGFTLALEPNGPRDPSVQLGNARGILPYTVLIGRDGRVLKTHLGAFPDVESLRAWVR